MYVLCVFMCFHALLCVSNAFYSFLTVFINLFMRFNLFCKSKQSILDCSSIVPTCGRATGVFFLLIFRSFVFSCLLFSSLVSVFDCWFPAPWPGRGHGAAHFHLNIVLFFKVKVRILLLFGATIALPFYLGFALLLTFFRMFVYY